MNKEAYLEGYLHKEAGGVQRLLRAGAKKGLGAAKTIGKALAYPSKVPSKIADKVPGLGKKEAKVVTNPKKSPFKAVGKYLTNTPMDKKVNPIRAALRYTTLGPRILPKGDLAFKGGIKAVGAYGVHENYKYLKGLNDKHNESTMAKADALETEGKPAQAAFLRGTTSGNMMDSLERMSGKGMLGVGADYVADRTVLGDIGKAVGLENPKGSPAYELLKNKLLQKIEITPSGDGRKVSIGSRSLDGFPKNSGSALGLIDSPIASYMAYKGADIGSELFGARRLIGEKPEQFIDYILGGSTAEELKILESNPEVAEWVNTAKDAYLEKEYGDRPALLAELMKLPLPQLKDLPKGFTDAWDDSVGKRERFATRRAKNIYKHYAAFNNPKNYAQALDATDKRVGYNADSQVAQIPSYLKTSAGLANEGWMKSKRVEQAKKDKANFGWMENGRAARRAEPQLDQLRSAHTAMLGGLPVTAN